MKTLSYVIEDGRVVVTGDSSKGTLDASGKRFNIDKPTVVNMENPLSIQTFFNMLLQFNHTYEFPAPNNILIDNVFYVIQNYSIESLLTKRSHYFPRMEPRNLFNLYKDFLSFHHTQQQSLQLESKLNELLDQFEIEKNVISTEDSERGIRITVANYRDEKYPDFVLLFQKNGTLKFLHFLEPEGEYYSSGDSPMTREMIMKKIHRAHNLLDKFDELFAKFNNIPL
jgi:hypothetical protein